jgi:hypothetical protein
LQVIATTAALPNITDRLQINGAPPPPEEDKAGNFLNQVIQLDGAGAGKCSGLWIINLPNSTDANNSSISHLNIINFSQGAGIRIEKADGCQIFNNVIGINEKDAAASNEYGIHLLRAFGTHIGGFGGLQQGNVVSGNDRDGILVDVASWDTVISQNFIGTNRNGLSGDVGNAGVGIRLNESYRTQVGVSGRNIIAGNGQDGILLDVSDENVISDNYIGVDVNGKALGNGSGGVLGSGIRIIRGDENIIGTTMPVDGGGNLQTPANLISCNLEHGVYIEEGLENRIIGNFIGTDASGLLAKDVNNNNVTWGNGKNGVLLGGMGVGTKKNIIGTSTNGDGNVIGNNGGDGVRIEGLLSAGNDVVGNNIGLNRVASKKMADQLGNFGSGVRILAGASANRVKMNNILFNQNAGVNLAGAGKGNLVQDPNLISANGSLGIDLSGTGVPTPNDPGDADAGPNNLQNFPVLTAAVQNPGMVQVSGSIDSAVGNSTYPIVIEFFDNTAGDPSGYGEGEIFLGMITVYGPGPFTAWLPGTGHFITATATDAAGNTSEFSNWVAVATPVTLSINDVSLAEGNAGTTNFTFTVSLSAASAQSVTVNYATMAGTAFSPGDFAAASGQLTFLPGEVSKTITVAVVGDTMSEANEQFFVQLTNPLNATLADGVGMGTIVNDDAAGPSLSINNVTQAEGNAGTTNFNFTVTLSAASAQTVTVNYSTMPGSATSPGDFAAASGQLTFLPGEISKTITVAVVGDTTSEAHETFAVNLLNPVNATIMQGVGTGTIQNDDAQVQIMSAGIMEGNAGTMTLYFTVSLLHPSVLSVSIDFATADGSATLAGGDYQSAAGTLTFNPGDTLKNIAVQILGDVLVEPGEDFFVNLSNPLNAVLSNSQGVGTIWNDDA